MNYYRLLSVSLMVIMACSIYGQGSMILGPKDYRTPNESVPIEKVISDEMRVLNKTYSTFTKVYLTDHKTKAERDVGILLNTEQVNQIKNYVGTDSAGLIIKMILSHELFHIFQFGIYSDKQIKNNSSLNMELECQADIFSGIYVGTKLYENSLKKFNNLTRNLDTSDLTVESVKQYFQSENKAAEDLYNTFFILGEKYDAGFHPTSDQRFKAAKLGFTYAGLLYVDSLGEFMDIVSYDKTIPLHKRLSIAKASLMINIDMLPNEAYTTWITRQSKRILHMSSAVNKYLLIENETVYFNKNPDENWVRFAFKVTNTAPFSVRCDFSVYCESVNREAPNNRHLSFNSSARNVNRDIGANRSFYIDDTLAWYGSRFVYPRLITLFSSEALYSFDFALEKDRVDPRFQTRGFHYIKEGNAINQLPYIMSNISSDAKVDFFNIRATPIFKDSIGIQFSCFYPNSFITAYKFFDYDEYWVTVDLYNGYDKNEAFRIYEKARNFLNDTYSTPNDDLQQYEINEGKNSNGKSMMYTPVKLKAGILEHYWTLTASTHGDHFKVNLNYYQDK